MRSDLTSMDRIGSDEETKLGGVSKALGGVFSTLGAIGTFMPPRYRPEPEWRV